jgi:SAM-dependent methyltransferase
MFRRRDRTASTPAPTFGATPSGGPSILDQYVRDAPSQQLAIDVFAGEWSSRFPDHVGVTAGQVPLFTDPRITWVVERIGGRDAMRDLRVLELGPLEGGHTAMLDEAGAHVTAIESNTRAYLKCLVTKEILGLTRSRFELGDFVPFLATTDHRYDLLVASGVLYHSPDPIGLLENIARVADRVAIWTHYFHDEVVAADPGKARMFVPSVESVDWRGESIVLHRRNYLESLQWAGFCGGPEESALWMERDGLMTVLHGLGFGRIEVQSDDLDNPNGACVMLLAQR